METFHYIRTGEPREADMTYLLETNTYIICFNTYDYRGSGRRAPEGERFPLERPAEGLTCKKYIKADTDRHIQYYALV